MNKENKNTEINYTLTFSPATINITFDKKFTSKHFFQLCIWTHSTFLKSTPLVHPPFKPIAFSQWKRVLTNCNNMDFGFQHSFMCHVQLCVMFTPVLCSLMCHVHLFLMFTLVSCSLVHHVHSCAMFIRVSCYSYSLVCYVHSWKSYSLMCHIHSSAKLTHASYSLKCHVNSCVIFTPVSCSFASCIHPSPDFTHDVCHNDHSYLTFTDEGDLLIKSNLI